MAHANDEYLDVDGNPLKRGAYYNLVDNNNKKINIFGYLGKNGNLKYQFTGNGAVTFKYINANGLNKGLRGISINTNPRFILRPEIVDTDIEDSDSDEDIDYDSDDENFGHGKKNAKRKTLKRKKTLKRRKTLKKRKMTKRRKIAKKS